MDIWETFADIGGRRGSVLFLQHFESYTHRYTHLQFALPGWSHSLKPDPFTCSCNAKKVINDEKEKKVSGWMSRRIENWAATACNQGAMNLSSA